MPEITLKSLDKRITDMSKTTDESLASIQKAVEEALKVKVAKVVKMKDPKTPVNTADMGFFGKCWNFTKKSVKYAATGGVCGTIGFIGGRWLAMKMEMIEE